MPRRSADAGPDLWRTFNRVQENIIRGGIVAIGLDPKGKPRQTTSREIVGIDQNVKLNKSLWALASETAALKEAA